MFVSCAFVWFCVSIKYTARNGLFQNSFYLFFVLFTDSLDQMVDPCGVYLDGSFHIDMSRVHDRNYFCSHDMSAVRAVSCTGADLFCG